MILQHDISLRPYNTFGMDVTAALFAGLTDKADLPELTRLSPVRHVLGGGSNILLTKPVTDLLVWNRLMGIAVEKEDEQQVWVRVQAGESWHRFVLYAIDKGLGGIENLALIPGTVGASPIQNIGAYGVEVRETIVSVEGWHWNDAAFITLDNAACGFGYRDSIFKNALKEQVLITSVLFRLNKQPVLRTNYGAITEELTALKLEPSVKNIAQAVINIRQSKLPDPRETGNAGSFFKNPTVPRSLYDALLKTYPGLPSYPVDDVMVKIPAGWLIEQAGWKGKRAGDAGVHKRQALVLVNYGTATGEEIYALSAEVIRSVQAMSGITLEREVQLW